MVFVINKKDSASAVSEYLDGKITFNVYMERIKNDEEVQFITPLRKRPRRSSAARKNIKSSIMCIDNMYPRRRSKKRKVRITEN